ncbi:MAG: helix-turn-helix transcriptional regulator [Lentisphaerota bacterium]
MGPIYFGDKNLSETEIRKILGNAADKRFTRFAAMLLDRAPAGEVFQWLAKEDFCRSWQGIRRQLKKNRWAAEDLGYWEKVYEILKRELRAQGVEIRRPVRPQSKLLAGIGEAMRKARKERGISQAALAKKAGMKQVAISRIESGQENITVLTWQKLATALGLQLVVSDGKKQLLRNGN